MTVALDFLSGLVPDTKGRYVSNYKNLTPFGWELNHDVIQWAFPTRTVSEYNPTAPVLPEVFNFTAEHQNTVIELMVAYLASLGIETFYAGKVLSFEYGNKPEVIAWLRYGNHNYKRLTRLIECLGLFQLKTEQTALAEFLIYNLAIKYGEFISTDTVVYWLATWQNARHKLQT
jgi:hypothetical protein